MKKILTFLGGTVLLLAVVLVFSLNNLVKRGIESFGSDVSKTSVTVDSVSISPFTGSGTITGLVIGNPEGFSNGHVFKLSTVDVSLSLKSLLSDTIIIEKILIHEPDIAYEVSPTGTNIGTLIKNLSSSDEKDTGKKGGAVDGDGDGKKTIIELVRLTGGKVRLGASVLKVGAAAPIPLTDIELRDIGRDGNGTTVAKATAKILLAVSAGIVKLGPKEIIKGTAGTAVDIMIGTGKTLEGVGKSLNKLLK